MRLSSLFAIAILAIANPSISSAASPMMPMPEATSHLCGCVRLDSVGVSCLNGNTYWSYVLRFEFRRCGGPGFNSIDNDFSIAFENSAFNPSAPVFATTLDPNTGVYHLDIFQHPNYRDFCRGQTPSMGRDWGYVAGLFLNCLNGVGTPTIDANCRLACDRTYNFWWYYTGYTNPGNGYYEKMGCCPPRPEE